MNRRSALISSLCLGLVPRALRGQEGRFEPLPSTAGEEPSARDRSGREAMFQPGHVLRIYDIQRYTALPHSSDTEHPEAALIDWIFRKTSSRAWHGSDRAMLVADQSELLAYHTPEVLDEVTSIWKRFAEALVDVLTLKVRIVATDDPRWRNTIYSRLTPKALSESGAGPQGQQAWLAEPDTVESLLVQLRVNQAYREIFNDKIDIINGQTFLSRNYEMRRYFAGLGRDSTVPLGYEPKVDAIREGADLRISPLVNYDGTAIDLAINLEAAVVRKLHRVRVVVPRQIGPSEIEIDVPEVVHTRINQTISNWPFDKALVVSGGILPGLLPERDGPLNNLFGPGQTELLVILEASARFTMADSPRSGNRE